MHQYISHLSPSSATESMKLCGGHVSDVRLIKFEFYEACDLVSNLITPVPVH